MEEKSRKKKMQNSGFLCYHYLRMRYYWSTRIDYLLKKKCISMGPLTISFKASGQQAVTHNGGAK